MLITRCLALATTCLLCTAALEHSGVDLGVEDECDGGASECYLSLRQLRGNVQVGEVDAHNVQAGQGQQVGPSAGAEAVRPGPGAWLAHPAQLAQRGQEEAEATEQDEEDDGSPFTGDSEYEEGKAFKGGSDDVFPLADLNDDGEIQHQEVLSFVAGLSNRSAQEVQAVFQAKDADSSQGLNASEFVAALELLDGGCAARRVHEYYVGGARYCCCQHNGVWVNCGCGGGGYWRSGVWYPHPIWRGAGWAHHYNHHHEYHPGGAIRPRPGGHGGAIRRKR